MFIPGGSYNVQEAIDADQSGPLPTGNYNCRLVGVRRTKSEQQIIDQGGQPNTFGMNLEFDVLEGDYAGRKIFVYIGMVHTVETVTKRGRRLWAELCSAAGFGGQTLESTDQVLGAVIAIKMEFRPARGDKQSDSECRNFLPYQQHGAPSHTTQSVGGTQQAQKSPQVAQVAQGAQQTPPHMQGQQSAPQGSQGQQTPQGGGGSAPW